MSCCVFFYRENRHHYSMLLFVIILILILLIFLLWFNKLKIRFYTWCLYNLALYFQFNNKKAHPVYLWPKYFNFNISNASLLGSVSVLDYGWLVRPWWLHWGSWEECIGTAQWASLTALISVSRARLSLIN